MTSNYHFDALRLDIRTQCGKELVFDPLHTLVNSGRNACLHNISYLESDYKLVRTLALATDRRKDGCWIWRRSILPNGYAQVVYSGQRFYVHRLSYILTHGPIGEGLQVDHLCRNRACWRPDHLEAVTCLENLLRGNTIAGRNAAKKACVNGHLYGEANLYMERYRARSGEVRYGRRCRICKGLPLKEVS